MTKKRKFIIMLCMLMSMIICSCGNKAEIDESKKYEVDGVIFKNDLMSICGVSTEEYLEVFQNQEIIYTYFSKEFKDAQKATILNLGGTVISVTPGFKYLETLPSSVLSVFEDDKEIVITGNLEEFFICKDASGNIAVYFETYHLYDEGEEGNTIKKYVTLKAYKVEFYYYSEPEIEKI